MKKFEYLIQIQYPSPLRKMDKFVTPDINKLGLDGWELVSSVTLKTATEENGYYFIIQHTFKRELI